jgi:hypothetical protein
MRPVIADTKAVQVEQIVLTVYCPDKVDDFDKASSRCGGVAHPVNHLAEAERLRTPARLEEPCRHRHRADLGPTPHPSCHWDSSLARRAGAIEPNRCT